MILSGDDKKTQREEKKIHARNKNKIIMKLEQDTATKASTVAFQSSSPLAYWSWALLSLWVWCFGKFTILR